MCHTGLGVENRSIPNDDLVVTGQRMASIFDGTTYLKILLGIWKMLYQDRP